MTSHMQEAGNERLTFSFGAPAAVRRHSAGPASVPALAAATEVHGPERRDWAFTALVAFTLVLFLRPQDILTPLEALHLAELTAGMGLIAMVTGRLGRRQSISRMTPEFLGVLAFGVVILATAPFSLWFGGSVGVFTELYIKVILIYLLAVNVVSSPARLDRLSWMLVLAVGFIGFRAVLDYARGVNVVSHGTRVRGSVGGIMGNPNDLALNMVVFLPLAICAALGHGSVGRRLVGAICTVFMLGAVVASGSRGGFLGLVVMLVVLGLMLIRHRPGYVAAAVLGVMCTLPLLPGTYWHRIASITDESKDDTGSREARQTLMEESLQAYAQNFIVGVGAGEFKDWNNDKREQAWHESHNVWLQVAAELGTVGLLVFLFLVIRAVMAVVQTRRMLRRARGSRRAGPVVDVPPSQLAWFDAHSSAMAASLAGWLVCAFFASVAYNWTFYYLLALAAIERDLLRAALPGPSAVKQAMRRPASRRVALAGGREARA